MREVEHLVAGHRPGSLPEDVPDTRLKRHVLRLELSGEGLAIFREAMAKIRRDAGEPLDDDAAILLLCRQALGGPKDPGRSSYQIALTVCESCHRAKQQGRGELIDVDPEILEMAECDGQHVGRANDDGTLRAHVGANDCATTHDRVPAAAARAHVGECQPVGAQKDDATPRAHVGAHQSAGPHDGAPARAHVGALPRRATQTIPPKIRRAVFHRDGGKCRVPGCRHAVYTDVHHLVLRSEDGKHSLENLVTVCGGHHHAIHLGKLIVTGLDSSHLQFTHADGTPYGGAVAPAVADARTKAFRALTGMGFREGEVKRALARIPLSVSSLEQLIRQTLRELAPQ